MLSFGGFLFLLCGFLCNGLFWLKQGFLFRLLSDQDRQSHGQDEKHRAQVNRAALENVCGASTKDLVGHTATEGRAQSFLFRTLHEDDEGHQKADDYEDDQQEIDAYVEPVS